MHDSSFPPRQIFIFWIFSMKRDTSGENNPNYRTGLKAFGKSHPIYNTWCNMKQRCFNTKSPKYKNYGARGIKICQEWLDIKKFYEWSLDNGWQNGYSIDRIDYDKDYCPENCRWISVSENSRSKHTTKLTFTDAENIRNEYYEGSSYEQLSKKYNCSTGNIWFIINNITHIKEEKGCITKLKALKNKNKEN